MHLIIQSFLWHISLPIDDECLLPELENLLSQLTSERQTIQTTISSAIQQYRSGLTMAETTLCYSMNVLKGVLESMVVVIALRSDLIDRFTPIFSSFVGSECFCITQFLMNYY